MELHWVSLKILSDYIYNFYYNWFSTERLVIIWYLTFRAKQGNDSIAADSVAATDNEEPVDVVLSPEKSKKGNVTKFTFNYSGKEVNVIADENKYEYYVKIDNKNFPLESEDYDFGSIKITK